MISFGNLTTNASKNWLAKIKIARSCAAAPSQYIFLYNKKNRFYDENFVCSFSRFSRPRAVFAVCRRHGWGKRSRLWPALGPPHAHGLIDEVAEGARPPHKKNGGHDMCAESPRPSFNQTFLITLLIAKTSLLSRAIRCAARRGLSTQSLCRTAFF